MEYGQSTTTLIGT